MRRALANWRASRAHCRSPKPLLQLPLPSSVLICSHTWTGTWQLQCLPQRLKDLVQLLGEGGMAGGAVLSEAGPARLKQLSNAAPGKASSFFFYALYGKQTRKKK